MFPVGKSLKLPVTSKISLRTDVELVRGYVRTAEGVNCGCVSALINVTVCVECH